MADSVYRVTEVIGVSSESNTTRATDSSWSTSRGADRNSANPGRETGHMSLAIPQAPAPRCRMGFH